VSVLNLFGGKATKPEPYLQYSAKARLYEYQDLLIVCSVEWIAETESLTVFETSVDSTLLGSAALQHLAEYSAAERDLSSHRKKDWPAFRASGARSVRAFERLLWHVDLALMNSAVLIWAAPRLSLNNEEISAYASASRHDPEKVGTAIRKAISAAKALRAQSVV